MVLLDTRFDDRINPLLWRIPIWTILTVFSVVQAHGTRLRVATAVLMGLSALTLQVIRHADHRVRIASLLITTAAASAATFTAHAGLAEILVLVAAGRAPYVLDGLVLTCFVVFDGILFAVTVAVVSGSVLGVLAGLAIPALVERTLEHQELVRERDRAQALLAEAQRVRESEAQAAALQERGRIAREMHDVLAHSLAGLSMQLQGLRAVAAREHAPDTLLEPLDKAAALARTGLTEARAAVGALRDPVGLGLAELPALVARHPGEAELNAAGVPVDVPAETGHAVYRAVQESLTNAARYAPGSPVTVTVRPNADELVVTVDDHGPGPGRTALAGQGTGLGLAGMSERVRGVGGTMQAGPRPGGGWRIELSVPTSTAVSA